MSRPNQPMSQTRTRYRVGYPPLSLNAKQTFCIVSMALMILVLIGCSQKPSGVYYQDLSFIAAQNPDTPNARKGFQDFLAEHGKDNKITIDGNHIELVMGKQFHLRGTFKVSGHILYLTPERIESQPLGVSITNADKPSSSGRKFAYEGYMPDDYTIMFMGSIFRWSKQ